VVKEMRDVFARLEAQGYPRERQEVSLLITQPACLAQAQTQLHEVALPDMHSAAPLAP
jgi:hypothetical protein